MLTCVGREHAALGQTALAKEIPLRMDCDDRFLPLLGNNVDLDLAFLNVKHRIRQIPLQEDPPILSICRYGPTPIHGGEKRCNIEGRLALCVHEKFPSMKPALCVLKTRCSSGRAFPLSSSVPAEGRPVGIMSLAEGGVGNVYYRKGSEVIF